MSVFEDTVTYRLSYRAGSLDGRGWPLNVFCRDDINLHREASAVIGDLLSACRHLVVEAKIDGIDQNAGWDCWISLAEKAIARAEGVSL